MEASKCHVLDVWKKNYWTTRGKNAIFWYSVSRQSQLGRKELVSWVTPQERSILTVFSKEIKMYIFNSFFWAVDFLGAKKGAQPRIDDLF